MENGAMAMEIKTGVFLSSLREDQKKVVKLLTFLTIKNLKILQSWFPSSGQIEENIANDQNDIVVHWTRAFHHGISNLALTNGWFFWTWSTKGDLLDQKFKFWERNKCWSGVWQQKMWSRQDYDCHLRVFSKCKRRVEFPLKLLVYSTLV